MNLSLSHSSSHLRLKLLHPRNSLRMIHQRRQIRRRARLRVVMRVESLDVPNRCIVLDSGESFVGKIIGFKKDSCLENIWR